MKIIGHLANGGTITYKDDVCIGDIVEIMDGGNQYTTFQKAYDYFGFGKAKPFYIKYKYDNIEGRKRTKSNVKLENRRNEWIVVNMAVHFDYHDQVVLHLRSRDFQNCVVGVEGVRVIRPIKKRPEALDINEIPKND